MEVIVSSETYNGTTWILYRTDGVFSASRIGDDVFGETHFTLADMADYMDMYGLVVLE